VDPVRGKKNLPQSLNRYSYVGGDPVNLYDPDGRNAAAAGSISSFFWWLLYGQTFGTEVVASAGGYVDTIEILTGGPGFDPDDYDLGGTGGGGTGQFSATQDPADFELTVSGTAEKIREILTDDHPCSEFFGTNWQPASNWLQNSLEQGILNYGTNTTTGISMKFPFTYNRQDRTWFPSAGTVNTRGPFFAHGTSRIGGYTAGSAASRILQFLHEMGHMILQPSSSGQVLLPWERGDEATRTQQSETNTNTVLQHCKDDIERVTQDR
jgi:hypothetical protein